MTSATNAGATVSKPVTQPRAQPGLACPVWALAASSAAMPCRAAQTRPAERQERPGQAAGPGTHFDDGRAVERGGRARDAGGEIEVEEEVLAERLARRKAVAADDIAQRRQVVDLAHAGTPAASRAASRSAAARLDGLARPLPAMSNAVP